MNKARFKIVLVQWLDARKHTDEVEIEKVTGGVLLISAGLLVKDEPNFIAIAADIGEDGYYRDVMAIPREYIKKMKVVGMSLTPPKPKHKSHNVKDGNLPNENPGPGTETTTG